jgi:hypothetical protein
MKVALPVSRASKEMKPLVRAANALTRKQPNPATARAEMAKAVAKTVNPATSGKTH